jgi:tetratricopeptide (TPR) repeat protein
VAQIGAVIGRGFSYGLIRSAAGIEDAALQAALERLAEADILLVQGLPPASDYRFKHALIQDAAYENLLKSRRQALHRRVGEVLLDQFATTAAAEPDLLAHHFTQAGLTEAAIEWWGKAGQRSLERSALREAGEQFIRALSLVESLPSTPALRRQQINFQVGLANALMDTKGRAAPETNASVDQARNLIKRAGELGETLEDPLVMFSVLYGLWNASYITFNGEALHELSTEILALAEKQATTAPVMIGHRLMAMSLLHAGDVTAARTHFDRAIALYDPAARRSLAIRFGQDAQVAILAFRSLALWLLGYPKTALADSDQAVRYARQLGQASTLMYALGVAKLPQMVCGNYVTANALIDELDALANDKGAGFWKGTELWRGWIFALTGEASEAVRMIIAGDNVHRSRGTTMNLPFGASYLASAYAQLARFDDARRCIGEAITATETSGERWCEAEINRIAGEIALMSPPHDTVKAQTYFDRALTVARQQQAKSWELRAAMSMARLWGDQGKREEILCRRGGGTVSVLTPPPKA